MVRTLTANAQTKVATLKGVEPIVVIKINSQYYADKDITISGSPSIVATGRIVSRSNISSEIKSDSLGQIGSMNVTLLDSDGTFKTMIDNNTLEGMACTVYLHPAVNRTRDISGRH